MPMKYFNSNHNSYYAQNQNAYPGAVIWRSTPASISNWTRFKSWICQSTRGGVMPADFMAIIAVDTLKPARLGQQHALSLWCNSQQVMGLY